QKGASLLTTDPAGIRDLALPDNSRVYMIAGTQHGGGGGNTPAPGPCANPTNPHSPAPGLRALVVALEAWASKGIAPPASRLPPIAVPLATYTGWNLYKTQQSELCDRDGSYIVFAKTRAEREAAGDPRPSLEERYGSRAVYAAKVREAADALVRERLLLPAD